MLTWAFWVFPFSMAAGIPEAVLVLGCAFRKPCLKALLFSGLGEKRMNVWSAVLWHSLVISASWPAWSVMARNSEAVIENFQDVLWSSSWSQGLIPFSDPPPPPPLPAPCPPDSFYSSFCISIFFNVYFFIWLSQVLAAACELLVAACEI